MGKETTLREVGEMLTHVVERMATGRVAQCPRADP
jgi:hypothetical protein